MSIDYGMRQQQTRMGESSGHTPVGSGPHQPPPSLSITEPSFTSHVVMNAPGTQAGASTPGKYFVYRLGRLG
jgi:hypothetical protein